MEISRYTMKKPSIKVYYKENKVNIEQIKQILFGMEEEGIPYEINAISSENAKDIAYKASLESSLGVGIGVDEKEIVLHLNKLEKGKPIFILEIGSTSDKKRSLGANAARLVTKMPFKEI